MFEFSLVKDNNKEEKSDTLNEGNLSHYNEFHRNASFQQSISKERKALAKS